jgi:hypothetical protein
MQREIILQRVPNADPKFVRIMEQVPEPKPEFAENVLAALPQMHEFFLQKREAYKHKDLFTFQRILDKEIAFVRNLDTLAYHY